ncbi:HAD-IA family hydrolase [Oricola sp.]|uniref:HAD-IA family hydrolase n=1 Tax=Oricola sp. TaxID=1979950 RepID=UPI003BAD2D42
MKPPIIVFDLDGTLIDTAPDLLAALNHALDRAEMAPVSSESDFRSAISHGARAMIEDAFASAERDLPTELSAELLDIFLVHYRTNMPGLSRPYEDVMSVIAGFADAGYIAAVCTNKVEANAIALLKALEIDSTFAAICGQDTFPVRKPDPGHLFGTIEMAGGDAARAIMIGDSETDIRTAQSAGIPVVAVDFGYTDRHVSEFGPDHVISHYSELSPALAETLIGKARAAG